MKQTKDSDFFVELDGIGSFRFKRRTFGDRARIRAEVLKITQGTGDDDQELAAYAGTIATHKVLCIEAPAGWEDLENLDICSGNQEEKVFKLYAALSVAEDRFRQEPDQGS